MRAMIDRKTFSMTYENFDKEVVVEIIDIFIAEYPERMAAIKKALDESDFDALNKHSHSLKGVVANFYDDTTHQLARQLEMKGKGQELAGAPELFHQLREGAQNLVEELKEIRLQYV